MMGVERERFSALVNSTLAGYSKTVTQVEADGWWAKCRDFDFLDIQRALKAHEEEPDDGKRAPRPVDISRRLRSGTRSGHGCAARGAAGACQYPGIFSTDTHGSSTWWCPWHAQDSSGPEAERWIQVSHEVPYAVAQAKRAERIHAESIRAPGVVETAQAIARRHGNKPWWQNGAQRFADPRHTVNQDAEDPA